jgi:hypothetical protein
MTICGVLPLMYLGPFQREVKIFLGTRRGNRTREGGPSMQNKLTIKEHQLRLPERFFEGGDEISEDSFSRQI